MDYEEYKRKALEPIVSYIESVMASYSKEELEARIKEALPEKEREDERIRKMLIEVVNITPAAIALEHREEMLAYLEKQKECSFCNFPKSCDDCPKEIQAAIDKKFGIDGRDDNDNPLNGYGDWKKGMVLNGPAILGLVELGTELHKEQKPAEYPEKGNEYWFGFNEGKGTVLDNPEQFGLYKPAEWSEEDEGMVRFYEMDHTNQIGDWPAIQVVEMRIRFKEWLTSRLKSLRPQPKQEWSEEDEKCLQTLIDYIGSEQTNIQKYGKKKSIAWLKSLRPSWKPSEEQMKALGIAIRCGIQLGTWEEDALRSLNDELKSL